ncbi:MAG: transposase [Rhodobacteraceae bacterium]|nr:transposase [Paracoccaceae bacterium]
MTITTIGLDIAKNVFQVHGIGESGETLLKRRLRRSQMFAFFAELPPCVIGMEACCYAHFWGMSHCLLKLA